METKITFGVIATNRNFFADSLVASGRRKVLDEAGGVWHRHGGAFRDGHQSGSRRNLVRRTEVRGALRQHQDGSTASW